MSEQQVTTSNIERVTAQMICLNIIFSEALTFCALRSYQQPFSATKKAIEKRIMRSLRAFSLLLVLVHNQAAIVFVSAFTPQLQQVRIQRRRPAPIVDSSSSSSLSIRHIHIRSRSRSGGSTSTQVPAVASLIAGSVAGAVGVGVAFPLDTLKTKSQVLASQQQLMEQTSNTNMTISASSSAAIPVQQQQQQQLDVTSLNMFQLMAYIHKEEGISGFFGGVKGMMVGQAVIKSVAFTANAMALQQLTALAGGVSNTATLLAAACFAGFVTSFLVTPIERIKVLLQASSKYKNELDCFKAILATDGLTGIFSRGLGPTLAREVPSYGIYFCLYGYLMQLSGVVAILGPILAPLMFGAAAGMACWIPVYPVDVVKTLVQNSDDGASADSWHVARDLYRERGIAGFFDGLTPKMLRAAINHSVTFLVYDWVLQFISRHAHHF